MAKPEKKTIFLSKEQTIKKNKASANSPSAVTKQLLKLVLPRKIDHRKGFNYGIIDWLLNDLMISLEKQIPFALLLSFFTPEKLYETLYRNKYSLPLAPYGEEQSTTNGI